MVMLRGIMADRGNGRGSTLRREACRVGQGGDGILAQVFEVVDLILEEVHPSVAFGIGSPGRRFDASSHVFGRLDGCKVP